MSDPFAASRLPDLPHAGYASNRQKETSDAIMFFLRGVERDRVLLLTMVLDGPDKFVRVARSAWRGLLVDAELLGPKPGGVFWYLTKLAGENPAQQLVILHGQAQFEARTAWDKRQRTKDALLKAHNAALRDLATEQAKPRKAYD